ncbi:DNA polymerase [Geomonas silvestris]|uniref:DNA polymerase I n=1 Tax=Geomonas silvestris TaxID=2740184 RepID=A0A6V8MMU2_9BACT|nr:DNA polymerase I [Geomonas silvestris]GFO60979.1 DNA polymerase [Geomonas silvestris]
MTTEREKLYLLDGSSYIYRAYFAIRHLSSPTGFPTNALYGFTQMLLKVMKDHAPAHVAVVFDAGKHTFRNELFPAYKATRSAMPDDLVPQLGPIKEMVRAFNIPALELSGFEADDIIGTIARQCEAKGLDCVVVTGDKDLMQIVSGHVTLLDTMKDKVTGIPEVHEKFGVAPERVVDVLALWGDASDNIPGVPGIGEVTAKKLIQEFGSLDELLSRAGEVKGKNSEKLVEFADQARLCRTLATIDCQVPIAYTMEELSVSAPDTKKLAELFRAYGFTTLMKELTSSATLSCEEYHVVLEEEELCTLAAELKKAGAFAIDLETTSLNPMEARIVGFAVSHKEHQAWYIPVGHRYLGAPEQLTETAVFEYLGPLLIDPGIRKIGQNLKYDYQVLRRAGVKLEGIWLDTMLAAYLENPGRSSQGLDALALQYLDHRMISYNEVAGNGKEQLNFSEVDLDRAGPYSCEDADATYLLHEILLPKVEEQGMSELLFKTEMPLLEILAEMELTGVKIDLDLMRELSTGFGKELVELEARIHELAGGPFNINSPKQLGEMLFERLMLPVGKKTKGKTGWSTNVEELERLAVEHEVARLLLMYRSISKLKSTYTDALPRLVEAETGRIHTSYNQAVTNTGRLSSSDPNLQNIPIRSEAGRDIRRAFVAEPGSLLLAADYSQIELRVLAHLSEDRVFCEAFAAGEDIHRRTAAEVFGMFPELVSAEQRRQAKVINFGVIYGQGAFSLAKELGVTPKLAKAFIDNYFERHSGARAFLDGCVREAEIAGFVRTILGRRLPIPDITSKNGNIRAFAQRNAVNYPIQGSAADIIKEAMIKVTRRMWAEGVKSRLIMQVHDELVFEVPLAERELMAELVRCEMEGALPLRVPLKVDLNFGTNWSEAH